MKKAGAFSRISRGMARILKTLGFIGCLLIGIMPLVVIANIVGRFFFEHPLKGTLEIVELSMLVLAFFAIPYTAGKRGHVSVSLIVSRFPGRLRELVRRAGFFLSALIIGIITYQTIVNTIYYFKNPYETTPILYIPLAPLRLIMAIGCIVLCLQLILDIFRTPQDDHQ